MQSINNTSREEYDRRNYILKAFLRGKPVFESFQNLCRQIGDDVIDYVEFEYWFMRFTNGKFDLDYDKSSDPETTTFSALPAEIVRRIVQKVTWKDVISLRQVSQFIRSTVDSTRINYNEASIFIQRTKTIMRINGYSGVYRAEIPVDMDTDLKRNFDNNIKKLFWDLKILAKHPKLLVENLNVFTGDRGIIKHHGEWTDSFFQKEYQFWIKLEFQLRRFHTFFPVKSIRIGSNALLADTFLQITKPGLLEKIELTDSTWFFEMRILKQYELAKQFKYTGAEGVVGTGPPHHFAISEVEMKHGNVDTLVQLKNQALTLNNFEKWRMFWKNSDWNPKEFDEFEQQIGHYSEKISKSSNYRIYVIEGNEKKIEITVRPDSMEFQRK